MDSIHGPLLLEDLSFDPFEQFARWYELARSCPAILNYNAMCLSTVGLDSWPEGRMVLLKTHDARGFVFYEPRFAQVPGAWAKS